jgi:hypothetical protein
MVFGKGNAQLNPPGLQWTGISPLCRYDKIETRLVFSVIASSSRNYKARRSRPMGG